MDHLSYAKHLPAEKQMEEFVNGNGIVVCWDKLRQNNHWLDATYIACAGTELIQPKPKRKPKESEPLTLLIFDGRPFLITER